MESDALPQFSALAHPQRLAAFRLLMRRYPEDVSAGDIALALGIPRSTLSPYLAVLRQAGLISQSRSGTFLLYQANVSGASALIDYLFEDCCRGRPALCVPAQPPAKRVTDNPKPYNVLFLCTGNSARSIMAESLLRDEASERFETFSAGIQPQSELNPMAVQLLRDTGHDVSGLRAKHVSEFQTPDAPHMDFVFTVCDRAANEECPPWAGQPVTGHWGHPDPAQATGTLAERHLAFRQVYGALQARIRAFAALPMDTLDRNLLQDSIDKIASKKDLGT